MVLALWLCAALFGLASVATAQETVVEQIASVAGEVILTAADGSTFPGAGVRLILSCESERLSRVEISDKRGAFRFLSVPANGCTVVTDLQGFRSAKAAIKAGKAAGLRFHLKVDPIFTGITVWGEASDTVRIRCHVSRYRYHVRRSP